MSIYDLGGEAPTVTTEHNHKTMISDAFNLQWENKVNKAEHYGNKSISLSTAQSDGLSNINDTLTQRVRIPKLDLSASIYRLFVFKKSQLSWRSTATITMVWRTSTLTTSGIASAPTFGILPTPYSG